MIDTIFLVLVVVVSLLLGIFVLINNPRGGVNRIFAALSSALAVWSIVSFLEDTGLSHNVVRVLVMFDFLLSGLMLGLFFWFCRVTARRKWRWFDSLLAILVVANTISAIAGTTVTLQFEPHHVKFVEQAGYPITLILIALALFGGLWVLASRYRRAVGVERAQLGFVLLGLCLMAAAIILTNVVLPDITTVSDLVTRLGIDSILIFTGFSAYAMIRHRFMDVRLVVARSLTYVLLLGTLAALYGVSIFAVTQLFFTGTQIGTGERAAYVGLAIVLAFTFQPLRRFFEHLTDHIFYHDRYDSQEVLNKLSTLLAVELNLERMLRQSLLRICQSLHIEYGQFVILKNDELYKIEHYGELPTKLLVMSKITKLGSAIVVADDLAGGERKEIMEDHSIRLSAGLRTHSELVGYLLLGDKLSGTTYSAQDIEVLQIAIKELAVAISNARAYEEIQTFNATLQDRVTRATSRLQVANRHLKELDKAKDEFISMASHQLRTPLTTIKGYLSMMLEGDTGKITADQRQFIEYAFDGSERMVSLISDLLNVSRLSAGRFVIERAPTDIVEMIEQEVRQLTTHAEAKGITLSFMPPKHPIPTIDLDGTKTRQVIMNFIDNAIYYTQKGTVTVAIDYDVQHIKVEVTDTGIGVPLAAQKHLFTKFYRADNAQKVRPDGTGLGLYLAKRVVEDQGGTIIFRTKEGQGSTFGFELPAKVARHVPEKAQANPKPARKEAHVG